MGMDTGSICVSPTSSLLPSPHNLSEDCLLQQKSSEGYSEFSPLSCVEVAWSLHSFQNCGSLRFLSDTFSLRQIFSRIHVSRMHNYALDAFKYLT